MKIEKVLEELKLDQSKTKELVDDNKYPDHTKYLSICYDIKQGLIEEIEEKLKI